MRFKNGILPLNFLFLKTKAIYLFFSSTHQTKKRLKTISLFIPNGLYYVAKNRFRKANWYNFFGFPFLCQIRTKYKSSTLIREGTLLHGAIKNVVITERCTYLFYSPSGLKVRRERIENARMLVYPKMKIFSIVPTEGLIIVERVMGENYGDKEHVKLLFSRMLDAIDKKLAQYEISNALFEDKNQYKVLYYVQHGDCHPNNIVWDTPHTFKFVDLDLVGAYPAFYDFFYFYAVSKRLTLFLEEKEIQDRFCMILKAKDCYYSNFMDLYLCLFLRLFCYNEISKKNLSNKQSFLSSLDGIKGDQYPLSFLEILKCQEKIKSLTGRE